VASSHLAFLLFLSFFIGMVGIIAIAMRLLDRYDVLSHLLGIHFLSLSINQMNGSHLLPFVEWILPKIFLTFKYELYCFFFVFLLLVFPFVLSIVEKGFPKFYLSRLFHSLLSITSESTVIVQVREFVLFLFDVCDLLY
jgi:hypothetical protein